MYFAIAIFRINIVNTAFWLLAPTYLAKNAFESRIEERIANMWRTHKNRVDRGLGGTYHSSGIHEGMTQDKNLILPNNYGTMFEAVMGAEMDTHFNQPHLRWHKSFEEYSSHLSDIDDHAMDIVDEYERLKKFRPLKKHVVGSTSIIPKQDNDEKFQWYDVQGESLYSNPPNP